MRAMRAISTTGRKWLGRMRRLYTTPTPRGTILGGKFTSRINLNLRERHGFTYGAHARFVEHRNGGLFVISAAVDTPSVAAAAREVLGELERLCQELVPRNELDDTQELNYPAIMKAIAATGYKGYVGQEYIPTWPDKIASLGHGVRLCDV